MWFPVSSSLQHQIVQNFTSTRSISAINNKQNANNPKIFPFKIDERCFLTLFLKLVCSFPLHQRYNILSAYFLTMYSRSNGYWKIISTLRGTALLMLSAFMFRHFQKVKFVENLLVRHHCRREKNNLRNSESGFTYSITSVRPKFYQYFPHRDLEKNKYQKFSTHFPDGLRLAAAAAAAPPPVSTSSDWKREISPDQTSGTRGQDTNYKYQGPDLTTTEHIRNFR